MKSAGYGEEHIRYLGSQPVSRRTARSGNCCLEVVPTECNDAARNLFDGPGIIARCGEIALAVECSESFLTIRNHQETVTNCDKNGIFAGFGLGKIGGWTNAAEELTSAQRVGKFVAF